jgi:hypothetical protein
MLINTYSYLKRFRQQYQTQIDTLSLLGQMLVTTIAVMFLLSVLGWATAINYAADWCDRLVESSLDSANPPQPPTVIQSTQPETTVLAKSEFVEEIASTVNALETEIPAPSTAKPSNTFRNIKKQATRNQMALQSVLR